MLRRSETILYKERSLFLLGKGGGGGKYEVFCDVSEVKTAVVILVRFV